MKRVNTFSTHDRNVETKMNNVNLTRRTWILFGIYLVTATVGFVILSRPINNSEDLNDKINLSEEGTVIKPPVKINPAQQNKTYDQILKEYDGRQIQFDERCQAIPNNLTYKNGTQVMFDNRSGDARWISVGGAEYYLSGYGYKILTLSSKTLPKTLYLNCGSAVNVGQILLQR